LLAARWKLADRSLYDALVARYREPRRRYHTLQHHWARSVTGSSRVHGLIMVTRHEAIPQAMDEKVLVDVDLWILGAPEMRFDEYEVQVREEYGWVPGPIYRRKRRELLESFLARPAIYNTDRFIQRYEARARANLARSLARL
jgi:predicted metal-dependent HD superfamily phosphohydrolase